MAPRVAVPSIKNARPFFLGGDFGAVAEILVLHVVQCNAMPECN